MPSAPVIHFVGKKPKKKAVKVVKKPSKKKGK